MLFCKLRLEGLFFHGFIKYELRIELYMAKIIKYIFYIYNFHFLANYDFVLL
jgi:hypothetical protein